MALHASLSIVLDVCRQSLKLEQRQKHHRKYHAARKASYNILYDGHYIVAPLSAMPASDVVYRIVHIFSKFQTLTKTSLSTCAATHALQLTSVCCAL